jgi:hypothetical protein
MTRCFGSEYLTPLWPLQQAVQLWSDSGMQPPSRERFFFRCLSSRHDNHATCLTRRPCSAPIILNLQPRITIEPMAKLGFDGARLKVIGRENALRLFAPLRG